VLRFGGEKALTKHDPVDVLKCASIENEGRMSLNVNDLVAENLAKVYTPRVLIEASPKLKAVRGKKTRASRRSRLSRVTQRLYNLESGSEPEKPLRIELDLYQMENW
jgi:hypothetical protein